ncbi:isoprenylcysteine carboxyl methyltransferase family protein [Priestia koreensis]|uniref:isoprenylcysteine carboxyl methyltransferase family protein n=1 Tax=Priestia koreensis TaxID=284581 RepID=UPI001F597591|nr:isoprenylcysteine carboxylmethyltransferase family protein [Priestia koreensis]MCM3003346.1 hypothetical protein [Priestia koreensis]UNL86144.1 hypothetical protein IE339_06495 [Priestia koreensis]
MIFYLFLVLVIVQRLSELVVAKRNEKWMKSKGAIEAGKEHYKWLVLLHCGFFLCLIGEVDYFQRDLFSTWKWVLGAFVLTQLLRLWVISSLGKYWNTKIIVLPQASIEMKGPYKYVKHPNYIIVAVEFILIPLLFQAYATLVLFTLLNLFVLSIRIPAEEEALKMHTNYEDAVNGMKKI